MDTNLSSHRLGGWELYIRDSVTVSPVLPLQLAVVNEVISCILEMQNKIEALLLNFP